MCMYVYSKSMLRCRHRFFIYSSEQKNTFGGDERTEVEIMKWKEVFQFGAQKKEK